MTKEKALDKAKIGLMSKDNCAFISTILFSLKFSWEPDADKCPSADTDGMNLRINPDFFLSLSKGERIFLLAHEAFHVAFQHMLRVDTRRQEHFSLWNQAADHYINLMLIRQRYDMTADGLADPKYQNQYIWSTDRIFEDLMANPTQVIPDFEPDLIATNDGDSKAEEVKQKVEDILVKAAVQSRLAGDKHGTIPGEIDVYLDKLLNPKLPWSTILANFLSEMSKEDYSYRHANKRFLPEFFLPSLYSESLGSIAIAVDTSCSVTDEQFTAFRTEIHHIQQTLQPTSMSVVSFDTQIREVHKITRSEDIRYLNFTGRGGTRLSPVFDHYNKRINLPRVLIIFSDLECTGITEKPSYPVIWIKLKGEGFQPSFGKIINFNV